MIGAWTINVSGRVYGPFTSDRMRSFVSEGRLAPHSLVAREGSEDWHEARDEPEFSDVFARRQNTPSTLRSVTKVAPSDPTPQEVPSSPLPSPQAGGTSAPVVAQPSQSAHANGNGTEAAPNQPSHFAVIVEQKSQSTGNLEAAITSLGPTYRLTHNVWIISTAQSVNAVRNRLVQELGKADSLFVIDASRGKAAWFNFGPEADVRIRRVWQKTT